MALYVWPPQSVDLVVPPLEINVDGVATAVNYDTATPSASVPVPVVVINPSGSGALNYGLASEAQRTAAQIGNATGVADFGAGNSSAQTLRAVIATDQAPVPVSGPLTDTQLRASAVPVSGPLTDTELRATAVPVSGPLTDTELRATAVPVSGPLTDTQLRATAVPVSASSLPLPTGAATSALQTSGNASLATIAGLDFATQTTLAALNAKDFATQTTLAAILAALSNNVSNGTPSQDNGTVSTSATPVAIPANTIGFIIQGYTGNAGLFWSLGGTAANDGSSGHLLEDSRDSGYIPFAAGTGNISLIGSAAAQRYQITWFKKA